MSTIVWVGGNAGSTVTTTTMDLATLANYIAVATGIAPTAAPGPTDDLIIGPDQTGQSWNISQHLAQLAGGLNSLTISQNYSGNIGVFASNTYMAIGGAATSTALTPTVLIGTNYTGSSSTGSGQIMIDLGASTASTNTTTVTVLNTGSPFNTGVGAAMIRGILPTAVLNVVNGNVSVNGNTLDTASTFGAFNITGGTFFEGSNVTVTEVDVSGGSVVLNSGGTTIIGEGGSITTNGVGAWTTVGVLAGCSFFSNSSGTITTLNVAGSADFSQIPTARTVSTINVFSGFNLNIDNGVKNSITITNGIITNECRLNSGNLTTWPTSTFKIS